MTEQEFLALEPRKRDALVAEKVMGWTDIRHGPGCDCCTDTWEEWTGRPPLRDGDDGKRFTLHPSCSQCGHKPDKWKESRVTADNTRTIHAYTTSIAAAWEVKDEIGTRLFSVRHRFTTALETVFPVEDRYRAWPDAIFALKPEHLCIAALKAVGEVT